jgi:hypothetical protein
MADAKETSSRRNLLLRGLVLVGGAVGLDAARRAESAQAATREAKGSELRLYGRNFHLHAPSRVAGQVPARGDRHSGYGELLDRPDGKVVGHFTAAHITHESPFAAAASSLEIHTFALKGGTIHGLGTVMRGAEGHFVILGGTGRYAGAHGGYVARQATRELGGDGTAEFHLTLAGREAAHGV